VAESRSYSLTRTSSTHALRSSSAGDLLGSDSPYALGGRPDGGEPTVTGKGLAVCDLQGTISAANATWSQLLGYPDGELHGRSLAEITHAEDREEVAELIRQLREGEIDSLCRELRFVHGSAQTVACRTLLSLAPRPAHGTSYLLVVIERLTEQKTLDAEQGVLRERLRQAQKMEAIGTLAGGIAHDFNNLLGVILGFASLARVRLRPGDPLQESLRMIEQSAERAADLSRQLLAFARPEKNEEIRSVKIEEILERVLKIITQTFDRRIQIRTCLEASLPSVKGDATMLEQVILNLCLNARDAISAGGTITIEGVASTLAPGGAELLAPAAPGGYMRVTVSDTGAGIDPQTLEHIFEPFFSTKDEGKGSGLGLAMVREIVSRHAGFMRVKSEAGVGSQFSVYLPALPHQLVNQGKKKPVRVERGSGEVLVVDDEPMVLAFVQKALKRLGYRVLTADNGKEACRVFAPRAGEIDCVLLDMVMPEMGGLETLHKLRGINPRIRIIVSSGYDPDAETRKLVESGAVALLRKPYSLETLARTMKANT